MFRLPCSSAGMHAGTPACALSTQLSSLAAAALCAHACRRGAVHAPQARRAPAARAPRRPPASRPASGARGGAHPAPRGACGAAPPARAPAARRGRTRPAARCSCACWAPRPPRASPTAPPTPAPCAPGPLRLNSARTPRPLPGPPVLRGPGWCRTAACCRRAACADGQRDPPTASSCPPAHPLQPAVKAGAPHCLQFGAQQRARASGRRARARS
jgi:hypothetical protein